MKLLGILLALSFASAAILRVEGLQCYVCDGDDCADATPEYCGPSETTNEPTESSTIPSTTSIPESTTVDSTTVVSTTAGPGNPESTTVDSTTIVSTTAASENTDSSTVGSTTIVSTTAVPENTDSSTVSSTTIVSTTAVPENTDSTTVGSTTIVSTTAAPENTDSTTVGSTTIVSTTAVSENTVSTTIASTTADQLVPESPAVDPPNQIALAVSGNPTAPIAPAEAIPAPSRARRSLAAQASEQLLRNYRSISRDDSNTDNYACFSIKGDSDKMKRGCINIPTDKSGCEAVRDKLNLDQDRDDNCKICFTDGCNSSATLQLSLAAFLFVAIFKCLM